MKRLEREIAGRIYDYENQKRVALSKKYPKLKKPILLLRYLARDIQNFLDFRIKYKKEDTFFDCVVARHQSVLRRTLGNSDPRLQEQKIINLKQAVKQLNGIIIMPGKIFSIWKIIGRPKYKKGYVDGMLLSNGNVIEGLGGGLCQLSNFLYWIFLHTENKIIERHHHSIDAFPDDNRTLPFGGGATIFYNFLDLKIQNTSKYPFQLKIWLTDNHLKGQILSSHQSAKKFHVKEKNHFFIKSGNKYFRYNEIYKETQINGEFKKIEKITTNFAPVLYKVTSEYLEKNNFKVLNITNK